ncbi:unnamed protein product [Coccothraustes coccothraustes]
MSSVPQTLTPAQQVWYKQHNKSSQPVLAHHVLVKPSKFSVTVGSCSPALRDEEGFGSLGEEKEAKNSQRKTRRNFCCYWKFLSPVDTSCPTHGPAWMSWGHSAGTEMVPSADTVTESSKVKSGCSRLSIQATIIPLIPNPRETWVGRHRNRAGQKEWDRLGNNRLYVGLKLSGVFPFLEYDVDGISGLSLSEDPHITTGPTNLCALGVSIFARRCAVIWDLLQARNRVHLQLSKIQDTTSGGEDVHGMVMVNK